MLPWEREVPVDAKLLLDGKLPIVFIRESNLYAMGTPLYRSLAVEDVSMRALAFGLARDRFGGSQ